MSKTSINDIQDNFVEAREPAELIMCIILAAAYAGLAKLCWQPLQATKNLSLFFNVEGFFITTAVLAFFIGLRPYLSPASLQISRYGLKYRGPYWPQRRTVNWQQILKVYVSPELIIVVYQPKPTSKIIWPMFIQSIYLSDKQKVVDSILKYSSKPIIRIAGPNWKTRLFLICVLIIFVVWILEMIIAAMGH